jgi:hypothetical protein
MRENPTAAFLAFARTSDEREEMGGGARVGGSA